MHGVICTFRIYTFCLEGIFYLPYLSFLLFELFIYLFICDAPNLTKDLKLCLLEETF